MGRNSMVCIANPARRDHSGTRQEVTEIRAGGGRQSGGPGQQPVRVGEGPGTGPDRPGCYTLGPSSRPACCDARMGM